MALALGKRSLFEKSVWAIRHARKDGVEGRFQLIEPPLADGDGRNHRDAQRLREGGHVDREAVALREVEHVERHDHRAAKRNQLHREAQVIVEVRGVDNNDKYGGDAFTRLLAHDRVARDLLVGARRGEAVGAGQVDELDRAPVGHDQPPGVPFDRDTGVVADLLSGTC